MKQRIYFNEVVTRDGFQMEPEFVPTDTKIELINALSQCGYAKIEVTSFTSAKAIPMLRDAEEVMGRIQRVPSVEYTVLVPNVRGAERAMEAKPDEFNLVMSTSETHNLSNLRMPREKSYAALKEVIRNIWRIKFPSMFLCQRALGAPWKVTSASKWFCNGRSGLQTSVSAGSPFAIPQAWPNLFKWPRCARSYNTDSHRFS